RKTKRWRSMRDGRWDSWTRVEANCSGPCVDRRRAALLQRPAHTFGDEAREGRNVAIDARAIESRKIRIAILDTDDGPGIAAGGQDRVHQESRHAAVAVRIGMNIAKQPVPENRAHAGFRFLFQ